MRYNEIILIYDDHNFTYDKNMYMEITNLSISFLSSIMGEPLSPDRVFDFLMDEPEPGPLPDYIGNLNNTNGSINSDVPLLGELGEMDEPLGAEEDLAMLFGVEDDFSDDDFEGPKGDEEVWEMEEEWLMVPVTPPSMPIMPSLITYKVGGSSTAAAEGHSLTLLAPEVLVPPSVIKDLCTRMGNLEYGHGLLVKKVMAAQMVQAMSRLEQVDTRMEQDQEDTTQRDEVIFGLSQQAQTLQAAVQHRDV
nr:hypothetical protein [Tanacetum cinerariifolium]